MTRLARVVPAIAVVALCLAPVRAAADDVCGKGYHKTGEQQETQGDTIIVHPVCEADVAKPVPPKCKPGYSRVGVGCLKEMSIRPPYTLAELRKQAASELEEIRYHNWQLWLGAYDVIVQGEPRSGPGVEDEQREMREHAQRYLEIQEKIEAITGDKARAKAKYEALMKRIYVHTEGDFTVNRSDYTAPGQTAFPDNDEKPN